MTRTGKIYRGKSLSGTIIEGELVYFGKRPSILGWDFSLINLPHDPEEIYRRSVGAAGEDAFAYWDVDPNSLERVEGFDIDDMIKICRATLDTIYYRRQPQ